MLVHLSNTLPVLTFFQLGASQLNTFEIFLNNAVHGIQGMGIISGMMNVAYAILLVGFLWELYQTALHGGDVKGLGKAAVKYLATALVVQAWPDVFIQVNTAFVHAGQWMTNAGGVSNVLDTWQQQLGDQFKQEGVQHMWNLITGEIAGLLDAILIFIAYLLYPIATLIFGFFYMLMGSVLFIFGPIVVSLLPLGVTNRLAKSYIEHIFIWNSWPLLYGGLGLLISAVHINNMPTLLSSQNFLGGLQGMEGSLMVGLISIVYSVAIAVIPFMAKSIVTGDVGSAARHMLSAATAAVTAGVGAAAGVAAGLSAAKAGAAANGGNSANAANATSPGGTKNSPLLGGNNQPAPPQPPPVPNANAPTNSAQNSSSNSPSSSNNAPAPGSNSAESSPGGSSNAPSAGGKESAASSGSSSPSGSQTPKTAAEKAAQSNNASAKQIAAGLESIHDGANEDRHSASEEGTGGPEITPASANHTDEAKPKSSPASSDPQPRAASGNSGSNGGGQKGAPSQKQGQASQSSSRSGNGSQGSAPRAPNPQHGLGTWGAYHAARIATQGAATAGGAIASGVKQVASAAQNPADAGKKIGISAGSSIGGMVKKANDAKNAVSEGVDKISHPARTVSDAAQGAKNTAKDAVSGMKEGFQQAYNHSKNQDEES
jgi:hypothetical protein